MERSKFGEIVTPEKNYYGISSRLDRLPRNGNWCNSLAVILGLIVFCDCYIQYVGGSMLSSMLATNWSTVDLNALCISLTMTGYAIGSVLSGVISDKYGRRLSILVCIGIFIPGCLCSAFVPNIEVLIICRFILGIGLGGGLVACYGCLCEYSPPKYRGQYSGIVGLIGNFSPPLGAFSVILLLPAVGWRFFYLGLTILGLLIFFLALKKIPESPRWLASKGDFEKADLILQNEERKVLNLGIDLENIDLDYIEKKSSYHLSHVRLIDLFRDKSMLKRLFVITFALFTMNVMVYTITNWTSALFVLKGFDESLALSVVAIFLLGGPFGLLMLVIFADKHGRKEGLLVSLVLLAFVSVLWGSIPFENAIALLFVGFFLCTILYYYALLTCSVYIGELFPTEIRMRSVGFANALGRIGSIISPFLVTNLLEQGDIGVIFIGGGLLCILTAIIISVFAIETRYRTLEDING